MLAGLTQLELDLVLKHFNYGSEDRFGAYILRIIKDGVEYTCALHREELEPYWGEINTDNFNKSFALVRKLIAEHCYRYALQALTQLYKARDIVRYKTAELRDGDILLRAKPAIEALLDERTAEAYGRKRKLGNKQGDDSYVEQARTLQTAGLTYQSPPKLGTYWDAAAAARALSSQVRYICTLSPHLPSLLREKTRKSAEENQELSDLLHRHAWSEIRSKCIRTVGMRLPPELERRVFEFALLAEGIHESWTEGHRRVRPVRKYGI